MEFHFYRIKAEDKKEKLNRKEAKISLLRNMHEKKQNEIREQNKGM